MKTYKTLSTLAILSSAFYGCGGDVPNSSSSESSINDSSSVSSNQASSTSSTTSSSSGQYALVMAINAGGGQVQYDGISYSADRYSSGGTSHSTTDSIAASALFQSERYGSYSYNIPVSEGTYDVTVHLAEIYHEQSGNRTVNVTVEGQSVARGLDVFAEVGHDKPHSISVENVAVKDGRLTIEVEGATGDGTMAGFAIYSDNGTLVVPTAPPGYAETEENASSDCPPVTLPEAGQLASNSKLPDPFIGLDGQRISTKEEWHCRRNEIREQAQKYIFGEKPPKPDVVTGSVSSSKVTVQVEHNGKSINYSADIVLPSSGSPPYPAIINLGAKGGFGGITLGESRILNQGVAVIYYNHYDLGVEGTPEASRGSANPGRFYDLYGGYHSAGLLMSWAWGASRMIDVLQESGQDIIDVSALGVTGCSRNGKGAFAVGVFDDRIALTIPHETSTGGVPALRVVDVLNTERSDHNYYGLNWLSNDFEPFVLNTKQLPIDTHALVGLVAPRGLLILENVHERQMGAPAGHTAAISGAEVYKALGVADNISYHSNVSNTGHCSYKNEYTGLLEQNIAKFLKREAAETGEFNVGSNGSLNLSEWKDWSAPSLD